MLYLSASQLSLYLIGLLMHALRAIVLDPLLGVVGRRGATCSRGGATWRRSRGTTRTTAGTVRASAGGSSSLER